MANAVIICVGLSCLIVVPPAARAQTCNEPHYRWSAKIDTTLAQLPPAPADIGRILAGWVPLDRTSAGACAPRSGREDSVFVLTGWVRRIQLHEADGDWHIELTAAATSPVTACIIVEIPAERYGAVYRAARAALAALVDTTRLGVRGGLATPVQVRFTGAAFFDGYHELPWPGGSPRPVLQAAAMPRCTRCGNSIRSTRWKQLERPACPAASPRKASALPRRWRERACLEARPLERSMASRGSRPALSSPGLA